MHIRFIPALLVSFVALVVVSGCSGGGSGGDADVKPKGKMTTPPPAGQPGQPGGQSTDPNNQGG